MARAIQPFSTFDDGDTLFAASTDDVPATALGQLDLDTLAGETMWDAILASVPQEPEFVPPKPMGMSPERLRSYVGTYAFGPNARLQVFVEDGVLFGIALDQPLFEFKPSMPLPMLPTSATEFYVAGRYHTRLGFVLDLDEKPISVMLNPGRWTQVGKRLSG